MPIRLRVLVNALGILLALSACKENKPKGCPPITAKVVPVTDEVDPNPVPSQDGLLMEGNKNSKWRIEITGGKPPFKLQSLSGINPDGRVTFENCCQSNVINARVPVNAEPEFPVRVLESRVLSASVVDANGCKSTHSPETAVQVSAPLPDEFEWAKPNPRLSRGIEIVTNNVAPEDEFTFVPTQPARRGPSGAAHPAHRP